MTTAPTGPLALTVHDGNGPLPEWRQQLVADWLRANRINPAQVSTNHPIHVLPVPADSDGWLMQIISFHQYYVGPDGEREVNYLTRRLALVERTVPMTAPFPTAPATDGEDHGQADGQATQETPEELVRDQEQEGVSDSRQGAREGSPEQGQTAWNEGAAEGRAQRRNEALPEPEEDRQEEVGAR